MARFMTATGYDRALIGGFIASEETRRRKDRDREIFHETLSRYRGREYLDRFDDRRRSLDIDTLTRRAAAINRHSSSAFRDDMIMELLDIADFQHAPVTMQQYLLTDRRIRYMARNQRIEAWGYNPSELEPDDELRHNRYYRAMNDGMLRVSEENEKDMFVEDFLCSDPDEELNYYDKRAIHYSVERARRILEEGLEDPTSKMNNLL